MNDVTEKPGGPTELGAPIAASAKGEDRRFWLTIFLPQGIAWECGDGVIRTRRTATGEIIMPARKCSGGAHTWLSAARNCQAHGETLPATGLSDRRVVTLSSEEEAEYERLYRQKQVAQEQVYKLQKAARMAVQQRNLMQRELKRIQALWLPLAERKFPR